MTIGFSMPMAGNWSGRQHTDEAARATVSGIDPFKQKPSADGILKLPSRLRRDLIVLVVIKLAMLALLYCLFFSPSHRPAIDTVSHIAGQQSR